MLGSVKRLGSLYFSNVRLKTTEKITILLSMVAFYATVMALGLVCLVFVSIGIGHLLATTLAPHLAYLFIALFYLILFVVTVMLRRQIFVDPISRFMSRLLVEVPEDEREAMRKAPPTQPTPSAPSVQPTPPVTPFCPVLPDGDDVDNDVDNDADNDAGSDADNDVDNDDADDVEEVDIYITEDPEDEQK